MAGVSTTSRTGPSQTGHAAPVEDERQAAMGHEVKHALEENPCNRETQTERSPPGVREQRGLHALFIGTAGAWN